MQQKVKSKDKMAGETLVYSKKTRHLFTEEEQAFFEKAEKNELFSPKYWKIQKETVLRKTKEHFESNPEQPLKSVVISILQSLPNNLPPHNLVEVAGYITKEWTQLQKAAIEA